MNRFNEQEFHKNLDLNLWKEVLLQAKPFSKTIWFLGIVMVLVGGLDSIFPLLTKYAIDNFIVPKQYNGIVGFSALYLGVLILNTIFVFLLIALAGKIETGMNNNLRKSCNHHLQKLSFSYYDRTPTGWIVTRLVSDISKLGDVVAWGIVDTV